MEALELLWPVVTGAFIVPITTWLKSKLPTDFPLQSNLISAALSIAIMALVKTYFIPEWTWEMTITFALGTQVVSQLTHSTKKQLKG